MSATIGDKLTAPILELFDGTDLGAKIGLAYLLVTADDDGSPRPCMLSVGEILAVDEQHLRLAIWQGTHTSTNLSSGRPCLFCYIAPGQVLYVRGAVRTLGRLAEHRLDCFEIEVASLESDDHPGMPVIETFRFGLTGQEPDEISREWQLRLDALRRL